MTRLTLAFAVFALLMLAAGAGWLCCWLWTRRARHASGAQARIAQLAAQLHAAEIARDAAQLRAMQAEAETAAARAEADAAAARNLAERRAELSAVMDALGEARREAARWRDAAQGEAAQTMADGPPA